VGKYFLFLLVFLFSSSSFSASWQKVGESELSFMFWRLYTAELFTHTGAYQEFEPPIKLTLTYHRNVNAKAISQYTVNEWQRLGYTSTESVRWADSLQDIIPDVRVGDKLAFEYQADRRAVLFVNDQVHHTFPPSPINQQFLAIWLSENSSFPQLTKQLKGISPK
jgi:hypothetical protein